MASLRRPLVATALSMMLVAGFTAPTFGGEKDDVKREQRENKKKLRDARGEVQESTKAARDAKNALGLAQVRLTAAQTALGQTRGQLAVAVANDGRLRAELEQAKAQLARAERRLEAAERELGESEGTVSQFAVDSVMSGDRGLQIFGDLLRGTDPIEFSEQMSISASVGDAQVAIMQELAASEVRLGVGRDKVGGLGDQVAAQRKQAEAVNHLDL